MATGLINRAPSAAETPEGKNRLAEYHAALGRFVDMFAKAEFAVALSLWFYAKTPNNIARAVFSGVRIKEGAGFIGRLAEVTEATAEARAELKYIFDQLGDITNARNDLLHYGAISVAEGTASVTNALKALNETRITSFPISPKILDDMTGDLRKIIFHLHGNHMGRQPLRGAMALEILHGAWRYRHQPTPAKQRTKEAKSPQIRTRAPKRARPPESSRA